MERKKTLAKKDHTFFKYKTKLQTFHEMMAEFDNCFRFDRAYFFLLF